LIESQEQDRELFAIRQAIAQREHRWQTQRTRSKYTNPISCLLFC
jgi:hypothetical protein